MLNKSQVIEYLETVKEQFITDSILDESESVFSELYRMGGTAITCDGQPLTVNIIHLAHDLNKSDETSYLYFGFEEHPHQYWAVTYDHEAWGEPWRDIINRGNENERSPSN